MKAYIRVAYILTHGHNFPPDKYLCLNKFVPLTWSRTRRRIVSGFRTARSVHAFLRTQNSACFFSSTYICYRIKSLPGQQQRTHTYARCVTMRITPQTRAPKIRDETTSACANCQAKETCLRRRISDIDIQLAAGWASRPSMPSGRVFDGHRSSGVYLFTTMYTSHLGYRRRNDLWQCRAERLAIRPNRLEG